ncbi:MAG: transcriptional repressor [Oscillospiraceae bacterium]|nr:transcriptional repressor [Oscillospiraceae bacterium]
MEVTTYKTKQREVILDYLKANSDKHLTVEDIANHFKNEVGQTTIYRYINMLVNDGLVRKYIVGIGQPACFQYTSTTKKCETHYHLKCNKCNRVFHVECEMFEDVEKYLQEKHCFKIDNSKLLLYGICKQCTN